ncbi:MAG: hypothetical protein ACFCUW_00705 [Kiloniellaceae bacterium]
MVHFSIDVSIDDSSSWSDPQRLMLKAGDAIFTRLIRSDTDSPDNFLQAPPIQLAFWIVDNWWRLRFEPVLSRRVTAEWRLSHELSAIGGGYIWPRLRIWGEGSRVGLSSRSDPSALTRPVRYITDALVFVSAAQFEDATFQFLEQAIEACSDDHDALRSQFDALQEERADEDIASWRRLEAQLGFDVDEAPEALVGILLDYIKRYGQNGVEEAVVAIQGYEAADTLKDEIAAAEQSRLTCDLRAAVKAAGTVHRGPEVPPWTAAEKAAVQLRRELTTHAGPLRNTRLAELLGVSKEVFRSRGTTAQSLRFGIRLKTAGRETNAIALRARWAHDRRFELCRALGDAIWSESDALGPITSTKTARQKFQRAFAQSLLCPFEDLRAYMNTEDPTEEDISAAAHHFHVAERVIQTVLVNKHIIERQDFEDMIEAA